MGPPLEEFLTDFAEKVTKEKNGGKLYKAYLARSSSSTSYINTYFKPDDYIYVALQNGEKLCILER